MGRKKKSRVIVQEFDDYFGTGTLQDWQRLCRDVGLSGDLPSISQCRKALKTVHVNIHDLLEAVKHGKQPQRFPNVQKLVHYTMRTGRFFPKDKVKEMGPVKALMRRIL
ncbi:hypothetical protein MYCTH_2114467 [Thermothelomyces thermophilus ATCC 42464]|uniref:Uncharacterized protein n=1 Tax=Thermothelomyces thermophilus (strain ATCC 42464 / BCRC 31852 / DSM 1799) TaxID=573729 RepID=G2Q3J0_THET4|nr:uncharacterized protein MYCTH_2114467 [Thermothelomyces thermophilus ATCC 42464]AEO53546.1 hypothetical protein MYCTH_2114467 [Thermothelomyces thermophilus ATCC 42464]